MLLGTCGLNLEAEWEPVTFLVNELPSSEVQSVGFSTERFPVVLWKGQ